MESLQYQVKVFYGTNSDIRMVPDVSALPISPGVHDLLVLDRKVGQYELGLYMFQNVWRFIATVEVLSMALANRRPLVVYSQLLVSTIVDAASLVYVNGVLYNSNILSTGSAIYVVVEPSADPSPDPDTDGTIIVGTASSALSAHRVVKLSGTAVSYLDNNDIANAYAGVGITLEGVAAGQLIKIKMLGDLTEPSWNFQLGKPVFCGANGMLVQQSPTQGFSLVVGVAAGSTKLIVDVKQPIVLI